MSCNHSNQYFDDVYLIFELINTCIISYIHSIDIYEYDVSSFEYQMQSKLQFYYLYILQCKITFQLIQEIEQLKAIYKTLKWCPISQSLIDHFVKSQRKKVCAYLSKLNGLFVTNSKAIWWIPCNRNLRINLR